jgi:molybdenum cofactor cytidylyltransferase
LKETAAVILAAGFSSRMGAFKPLLVLGGMTLLARVVRLFQGVGAGRILVVCGHRGHETAQEAKALGATPVINRGYAGGMFSSVKAGLAQAGRSRAAWVLPVDIPLIRPGTLRIMHAAWSSSRPPLTHPTFSGVTGHPPLLDRAVWPQVLRYSGGQGLMGALRPWQDQALQAACGDRNILLDLDTPQHLKVMRLRVERLGVPGRGESDELAREVFGFTPALLEHGQMVAGTALKLARALPGHGLDEDLIYAAGLLHDLAKDQPRHAQAGANRLHKMGLDQVAEVVARHGDMPVPASGRLGEAELVCLADKCVQDGRLVTPDERYCIKLKMFRSDPKVCAAIRRKRENCRGLQNLWERLSGRGLEPLLAQESINA